MGKRNRYRDHIDPEHRRWGLRYPRFPGVGECVRLINDGKARGTWADIIASELAENAADCLPELFEAFRSDATGNVRLYVMMALDIARVPETVPFLSEVLRAGDPRHIPYAERALQGIDTPEARSALWRCRRMRKTGDESRVVAGGVDVDWTSVFDEAHPRPGASDTVLAQFVTEVARPVSVAEIRGINAGQRNPFPAPDPLRAAWRPFDAAQWVIPDRPLPEAYLSFLRWSDGGEFRTGERWFQFFPALDRQHGVRAMMLSYHLPEYMPAAVPFGFDGCGTFYLFDMRRPAVGGEYPVVTAHAGCLGWDEEAFGQIAEAFVEACRGSHSDGS